MSRHAAALTGGRHGQSILFADINGFTRLSEEGFAGPQGLGHLLDEWRERVVGFVWEHGGVFDKMVGDCVIGLFGPNRRYTAFSPGMNNTARLQSLGGFRETLLMESVREVLRHSDDPALRALDFGTLQETPVRNVAQPLRHYRPH